MSRLTLLYINIIGVVVALLVGAGLWFLLIDPAKKTIETNTQARDAVMARAAKYEQHMALKKQAEEAKLAAEKDYVVFERQYMPIIGYRSDRVRTMMQTFWPNNGKSWPERFIRTFRAHMNHQQRRHRVVWLNQATLTLGPYGPDPNSIQVGNHPGEGYGEAGAIHYTFPMQVRAPSLGAVMRHIADWNQVRGMGAAAAYGLSLQGNSPDLVASYTVTLTIIRRDTIPPPVTNVTGSGGGSGGGGGRGMGPMGMMGMGGGPMGPMGAPGPGGIGTGGPMGGGRGMGPMMAPGGPGGPGGIGTGGPMGGGGGMGPVMAAPGGAAPGR